MKTRSPIGLVDELGRLASRAEPPSLDEGDARRLIERAMWSPPKPHAARRPYGWAIASAAIAAALVLWLVPRASVEPNLSRVTLPTGDRLVGVAGARFDVERLDAADRRLRVRGGTVLFDVAHVVAGQRFSVATDQLVVTAKGTVFSVEADARVSRVRVYEGSVEVAQAGTTHALAAGGVWDSSTGAIEPNVQPPAVLADSVETVIRDRASSPITATAAAPIVATAAASIDAVPTATSSTAPAVATPAPSAASTVPAPAIPAAPGLAIAARAPPPAALSAHAPEAAPTGEARSPTDAPPASDSPVELFLRARAEVAAGKLDEALATAKLAAARTPLSGPWWRIVADALRGLGRAAEAADAFDHAARDLTGADRVEAGYSAAYVRFHDLHEAEPALTSLTVSGADVEGSALEERALGLRVQIVVALGHRDDARPLAARYLARFPHADLGAYMRTLVGK